MKGLTQSEVLQSREKHGDNLLTPPKRKSPWRLFFEKFKDPVIRILLIAALLSLGIGFIHNEFAETIGIFCAIFLATGIAFWFEYDAMKKFDLLNSTNDDTPVKVIRDGEVCEIPKKEVVVGDIVLLESGEEVPADGQLIEAVSLKINESTLTGELQVDKTVDPNHFDPEATYPSDHVMRGTTVMEGHGVMEVFAVGDATEFGKVAEQATVESDEDTPLNLQLKRLSKWIGRIGISLAILTFIALIVKGIIVGDLLQADWTDVAAEVLQYFMVAVTLIVVAVPEGLPMSVTLSLAVNMRRMLRTNNLVRKMHASETMGAITVICTDKTGTLTRNEMRVHDTVFYIDDMQTIEEGIAAIELGIMHAWNGVAVRCGESSLSADQLLTALPNEISVRLSDKLCRPETLLNLAKEDKLPLALYDLAAPELQQRLFDIMEENAQAKWFKPLAEQGPRNDVAGLLKCIKINGKKIGGKVQDMSLENPAWAEIFAAEGFYDDEHIVKLMRSGNKQAILLWGGRNNLNQKQYTALLFGPCAYLAPQMKYHGKK